MGLILLDFIFDFVLSEYWEDFYIALSVLNKNSRTFILNHFKSGKFLGLKRNLAFLLQSEIGRSLDN